jgi:hypothetical protein
MAARTTRRLQPFVQHLVAVPHGPAQDVQAVPRAGELAAGAHQHAATERIVAVLLEGVPLSQAGEYRDRTSSTSPARTVSMTLC